MKIVVWKIVVLGALLFTLGLSACHTMGVMVELEDGKLKIEVDPLEAGCAALGLIGVGDYVSGYCDDATTNPVT